MADGVGGWNDYGVDPKAYSNKICSLVMQNVKSHEDLYGNENKMNKDILKSIFVKSVKQNTEQGSSTLLVIYLDPNKNKSDLYTAYLGDSTFMIARPKRIGNFELIEKAEEQCHSFNYPFQVGECGDDPYQVNVKKHQVKEFDIVVAGTDGLWDNIEAEEIIEEINKLSKKYNSLKINTEDLSKTISIKAENYSNDRNHLSPFAKKARQGKYKDLKGGKPDDITVVSAQILKNNPDECLYEIDLKQESSQDTIQTTTKIEKKFSTENFSDFTCTTADTSGKDIILSNHEEGEETNFS